MKIIADFHIHSRYSRACSKELLLPNIAKWCEIKGIDVVGTGDFTHPAWFGHIKEELTEVHDGVFALKNGKSKTRFVLSTELSSIYTQGDKVRRIHLCVLLSSVAAAAKFIKLLDDRGVNLKSDGRPILGIPAKELVKLALEADDRALVIPAHAWTPWFSVFGSKSGFDSLAECFGEMTKYIYAIETGLSSDPAMNWRVSALNNILLVSNSDAHSLRKLGREANVFEVEKFDYPTLYAILKTHDTKRFLQTIEFFPEEGKYHLDGHRECRVCLTPAESKRAGGICPKCKKMLTLGVVHRVEALADRAEGFRPAHAVPFRRIVPLEIVIGEAVGKNPGTKTVNAVYQKLVDEVGTEFDILLETTYEKIGSVASKEVVEAVRRVREGNLSIAPGYDGVYGTVRIFKPDENQRVKQTALL